MGVAGCSPRPSDAVAAWFLQMLDGPGALSRAMCRLLDIVPVRVAVGRSNNGTSGSRRSPLDFAARDDQPVCETGPSSVASLETSTTRCGRGPPRDGARRQKPVHPRPAAAHPAPPAHVRARPTRRPPTLPPRAAPTTLNPPASRTLRARRRNGPWSSTADTVRSVCGSSRHDHAWSGKALISQRDQGSHR
jgi:hypothetical protein